VNRNYSSLLSDLIDKSGLSLTEICARAEKHGQKITSSYLSKLKNGKMPPPSFKMSIALALSLEIDPELLLAEGIKDNSKGNQEELEKALHELHPEMDENELVKTASRIIESP
jgi:repressor LexA